MAEEMKWELDKIVDNEFCARCGTCAIVCPNNIVEFTDKPGLAEDPCKRDGHGMCKEVCPRVDSGKYQIAIRAKLFEEFYYGKGSIKGQDGGVVTSFLKYLIENNKIDGAIVVGDDNWKPVSLVVKDEEGLKDATKSKYTVSTLDALNTAGEMGLEKVAVVALPCQIAGLRKLQYHGYLAKHDPEKGWDGKAAKLPKIEYLIGLFCTEKFEQKTLLNVLEENNIDIKDVTKFDVQKGKFVIETANNSNAEDNKIELPVKGIELAPGCKWCRDFDAELADVSVGSVGSPDGYSTIVVRSEKGREIANAIDLETGVEEGAINFLKDFKNKRFNKTLVNAQENDDFISYYWNDDYGGVSKRPDGTYFIRARAKPSGWYTLEETQFFVDIAEEYGTRIKLTDRGAYELHDFKPADVEEAVAKFTEAGMITGSEGPLVRATLACPGDSNCGSGLFNTTELCQVMEDNFAERPATYKFKIAISGCPNKCVRPQIHDFGIAGIKYPQTNEDKCNGCGRCEDVCKVEAIDIRGDTSYTNYDICIGCGKCFKACPHDAKDVKEEGFTLYIGGQSGREVVEGVALNVATQEEITPILKSVFSVYDDLGEKPQKERLAATMKRVGQAEFMKQVYKNLEDN